MHALLLRHRDSGAVRSIVMSMSVCLSVCPLAYLRNHAVELYQFFCTVAKTRSSSDASAGESIPGLPFSGNSGHFPFPNSGNERDAIPGRLMRIAEDGLLLMTHELIDRWIIQVHYIRQSHTLIMLTQYSCPLNSYRNVPLRAS